MDVAARPLLALDSSFARTLPELSQPFQAAPTPAPRLLVLNDELAGELGLDAAGLRSADGVALLTGHGLPDDATPVAQAYAGHQFGMFQPRLGDGRALLLGELTDVDGRQRDLHLKGSGRTLFARGGDGRAAVGPMLREYVISEAIHALGIPTTRSLAVVATGADVVRETVLPGAVLARVASSPLRVGTFQYAALYDDPALGRRLADFAIARHHPEVAGAENPYLAFFEAVVEAQASLVARWMLVGFVHGVMNTDNMTISGETIDYGPCAFLDAFDLATVFSSIDEGGRYAYGNQPGIAQWNLARFGESLLGLLGSDGSEDGDRDAAVAAAVSVLDTFSARFGAHWSRGLRAKLGLTEERPDDGPLVNDLLALLGAHHVDFTSFFRALSTAARGDVRPARALVTDPAAFDAWAQRWRTRLTDPVPAAAAMDRVNPVYVPRNHQVEAALIAATAGDLEPVARLLEVVTRPFDERPGLAAYAEADPAADGRYRTFCGT